ncbi:flagella basal body P-ring formation protein FlgA [Oxalobacteraceae bacterium GrIS 1.11]
MITPDIHCATGGARRVATRCLFILLGLYSSPGWTQFPVDNIVSRIEAAARAQLLRQAAAGGWQEALFEVTVTPRPLPACAQAPTLAPLDVRQPNRMRFSVICPDSGGWKVEFVVRATTSAMVAVSAAPVAAGLALTAQDMALERRDISAVDDSIGDMRAVLGMASRRALRAGELLHRKQLAPPPLVRRGDLVRIVARREQVEVSMAGEALDEGAQDAVVRVRNSTSGTVIRARVRTAGTVEPVASIQSPD